jgi:Transposase DDE domain group 1
MPRANGIRELVIRTLNALASVWTQALVLDGELSRTEPKTLRYRLLHVAARLAFHGRRGKLHLQNTWAWATELIAAFDKPNTLTPQTG